MSARALAMFSDWRFWLVVGVLAIVIAFAAIGGALLQTIRKENRNAVAAAEARAIAVAERDARFSEKRGAVRAKYQACLASRPTLTQVNTYTRELKDTLLQNARATHRITERDTPVWRQQMKNIANLAGVSLHFPVPSEQECLDTRDLALSVIAADAEAASKAAIKSKATARD